MNKKGKLIVQPMGGLANRMRVLSFSRWMADRCGVELNCLWNVNDELYAPINTIFQPLPFSVKDMYGSQPQMRRSGKWYKNIKAYWWLLRNRIDMWLSYDHVEEALDDDNETVRAILAEEIEKTLRDGKTVYMATGDMLSNCKDMSIYRPTESIMEDVNNYMTPFEKGHRYGLHIRRTDNTWAIEHSPIDLFENKIEEIIAKDKLAKFYLATDDADTAKHLCDKYGEYIVYREKELSRTSESGIREAVIDMWLLGNMDEIYGSYWSSFSEVASWIHNKPLYCISK